MNKLSALQTEKFYRIKNPRRNFLCALCTSPRQMKYSRNLSSKQLVQIVVLSVFLGWVSFPFMGVKSLVLIFPVWILIELVNKMLYRKDIPCPYCGFDATWYRRDVSVANKKVKDFWKNNTSETETTAEPEVPVQMNEQVNETNVENNSHTEATS